MTAESNIVRNTRFFTRACAAIVLTLSAIVMLGWVLDNNILKSFGTGSKTINPITALCFIVSAAATFALTFKNYRWAAYLGFVPLTFGAIKFLDYSLGISTGVDLLLFSDRVGINRTSVTSSTCFMLLGLGLALTEFETKRGFRPSQLLAAIAGMFSFFVVTGYIYQSVALTKVMTNIPMALPTGLCFITLSLAVFTLRSDKGWMRVMTGDDAGGLTARRLIPLVFLVPTFAGFIRLEGQYRGLYDTGFGTALFSITIIIVLALLVYNTAERMHHLDLDRRRVDAAQKRLASVVESTSDAVYTSDLKGIVVSWNKGAEKLYGYKSEEMVGKPLSVIVPSNRPDELSRIFGLVEAGEILENYETLRITKDGRELKVSLTVSALRSDENDVNGVCIIARDVTEQKYIEDQIRRSNIFLDSLVENIPVMMFVKDAKELRFLRFNKAGESLLGYDRSDFIGKNDYDFFSKEQADFFTAKDREVLEKGVMVDIAEEPIRSKDGRDIILHTRKIPILDKEGKPLYLLGLSEDITQFKFMQQELESTRDAALELARVKSDFLANMSHEIRTPMNAIIGMTELLVDTELDPQQRRYATTVQKASETLLQIINDILDFSKMEAGKMRMDEVDFDVRDVIESTLEIMAARAHAKGLELAFWVGTDVPTVLRGDPGRLRQVLMNLIGNAVKFTEKGEIFVRVLRLLEDEKESKNVRLRFEIKDTGVGISEEARERLFRPFVQADNSTTRKYGGTGLGLAISKKIVNLMDGEIDVESEEGKGSTFWFTGRFAESSSLCVLPPERLAVLGKKRALIVDDNETNRRILHDQLTKWGILSDSAVSGSMALQMLEECRQKDEGYDFAIFDMHMPGMDGLTLARTIRQYPDYAKLRIVILSSLGQALSKEDMAGAGISECLTKPIRQVILYQSVKRLLSESGPEVTTPSGEVKTRPQVHQKASAGHILVVEDNATNQQVILLQLQKLGYKAKAVFNGKKALEALDQLPFAAILMDCQMPEMDGYEATKEIRQRQEGRLHTPIIAMTANALEGDREKCLAAGMDDYISKPINIKELKTVLEKWVTPVCSAKLKEFRELVGTEEEYQAFLAQLFPTYINDIPGYLADLAAGMKESDLAKVQHAAHAAKGSSGNVGAYPLMSLAARVEQQGREGKKEGLDELYAGMQEEFEHVKESMQLILDSREEKKNAA